jgi:hypothetical protein
VALCWFRPCSSLYAPIMGDSNMWCFIILAGSKVWDV